MQQHRCTSLPLLQFKAPLHLNLHSQPTMPLGSTPSFLIGSTSRAEGIGMCPPHPAAGTYMSKPSLGIKTLLYSIKLPADLSGRFFGCSQLTYPCSNLHHRQQMPLSLSCPIAGLSCVTSSVHSSVTFLSHCRVGSRAACI